jgi:glycosyltransferase involved in cell wall biosynthesis
MDSPTSSKRRILFIITQSEMGGAQRFLYNLLARISPNYEIRVAVGSDGGHELIEQFNGIGISVTRLKKLRRDINPLEDIGAIFEIRELIKEFQPDDLYLGSSKAGFIGSLATVFPSRIPNLKVIYRIGGWTFNDPWPAWKKNLWINLEKLSAQWKDVIIVNNKHDLEQAKSLNIKPRQSIVLIHNGIDPYKLDFTSRDEARFKIFEKLSKNSARIFQAETIIGTVANFYPPKGLNYLIETAEHFKNNEEIVFAVIGDGPERENLERQIREKGLEKKIFLLGKIKDGYKFMPAFDMFVLPSVKEGFPFAILEAMAAKIPVIATRVGSIPEVIENGKNGFIVEPGNPAALAGKIKELLASDYLYKEFAIQGHQTLLFNFSEDKMVKEIEALL